MSKPTHLSEHSIRKLLSEHVEQGIPGDVDLWHAVQRRMAERESAAEQPRQGKWFDWLLGAPLPRDGAAVAGVKTPRRAYRYAQLAAGLVGLLLVAGLTTLVISRLAARPSVTPGGAGTATAGSQLQQNTPASTIATAEAVTPSGMPPNTPTPITDLATLVRKADIIARVKVTEGTNPPSGSSAYDLRPVAWLKRPGWVTATSYLRLLTYYSFRGVALSPTPAPINVDEEYIVFLDNTGIDPGTHSPDYALTDDAAGMFGVRDGKIYQSGIAGYMGQPVAKLQDDISALLPPAGSTKLGPVSLVSEGDGFRMQASGGKWPSEHWLDPSHLLVDWSVRVSSSQTNSVPVYTSTVYLLDLTTSTFRYVMPACFECELRVFPDQAGKYAVLLWRDPNTGWLAELDVLDVPAVQVQTVFSADPSTSQWAAGSGRDLFSGVSSFGGAGVTWFGPVAFEITVQPTSDPSAGTIVPPNWGKLLLVDIAKHAVSVLAEKGTLVAAFPNGDLLVQANWIDGEIQLYAPPYTAQPVTIAPAGPWRQGWAVDPHQARVAWLDMTAPPGDWSKSLPHGCCGGGPGPVAEAVAIWDHAAGRLERFPVPNYSWSIPEGWPQDEKLHWRATGGAVLYTVHPDASDLSTLLYQRDTSGASILLAKQQPYGSIKPVAEGNDGALYYETVGAAGTHMDQLMRRSSDGTITVVRSNSLPLEWSVDDKGFLFSLKDGKVQIEDLVTGITRQVAIPGKQITTLNLYSPPIADIVSLSPDALLATYHATDGSDEGVIHIIRTTQPPTK